MRPMNTLRIVHARPPWVLLGLVWAWRMGATPEQIISALVDKQTKNEKRKWPDWRTAEPGKAIEHIDESPEPPKEKGA